MIKSIDLSADEIAFHRVLVVNDEPVRQLGSVIG